LFWILRPQSISNHIAAVKFGSLPSRAA
jgi:hypothetical protein